MSDADGDDEHKRRDGDRRRPPTNRDRRDARPSERGSGGARAPRGPFGGDRPFRGDRPHRGDRSSGGDRSSSGDRSSGGAGRPFPRREDGRGSRPPGARDEAPAPRHDDPVIPDDVAAAQLDRAARAELRTLSKDNADWVARHLVMASRLIEDDPALAHKHAEAAARRAGRVAVVRETLGITAYAIGDFALALRELRTYRRLSGNNDQLPLMVDSERGVGRPDRALELGRSVPRGELDPAVQVSLAIAMSGARLDLGQPDLALGELEISQLERDRAYAWSPALFDAYATVLEELGRDEEAQEWWQLSERATEALERAAIPEGGDTVEIIEEEWNPDAPAE